MSLRKKLILTFVALAILPLLGLATFSNWYAQSILRTSAQTQLQEQAHVLGEELASRLTQAEGELKFLARALAANDREAGSAVDLERVIAEDFLIGRAAFLRFDGPTGISRFLSGQVPEELHRCDELGGSRIITVPFTLPEIGEVGVVTAGFWAKDLLGGGWSGGSEQAHVVNRETGQAIFSADCQILQSTPPEFFSTGRSSSLPSTEPDGAFSVRRAGETRLGAVAPVPGTPWAVVRTAPPVPVASSINRLVVAYWVFVLLLAFATGFAFYVLLGRFTKALQELARAAEEIGTGELDPWLPLPTSGEVGQLTMAFSRMLARIRQMMSKVDQSGRLAVVGQLSAYLAHEIRNPLSSIKLNLQRLQRWSRNGSIPEFCTDPIEISLKEVDRLNASVSGVLELSSAPNSPLEPVSLHALVEEASNLLAGRFRRQGVVLTLDLDAEADRVLARVGQIKSVILNLMVNALEAQPHGGSLEIRSNLTRRIEMGGPAVALHFKDGGAGIPPDIRDRIFEPFFSTKPGGSGIGLAMASQAVQDCLGELYLEPSFSVESGADFVMVLPLAAVEPRVSGETDRRPGWSGPSSDWPGGQGRSAPPPGPNLPSHLMTPSGMRAVLNLSGDDPEEMN